MMDDGKSESHPPDTELTDYQIATAAARKEEFETMELATVPLTYRTLDALIKHTPTLPNRYKDSATGTQDALAAVYVGRELNIGPMQAIANLYLVNGEVSMKGQLMSALVHRAGHAISVKITAEKAVATAWRRQPDGSLREMGTSEFTKKDAEVAELWGENAWVKYPKTMLSWRAIGALCRVYFGDCLFGFGYMPEEMAHSDVVERIPDEIEIDADGVNLDSDGAVHMLEEGGIAIEEAEIVVGTEAT